MTAVASTLKVVPTHRTQRLLPAVAAALLACTLLVLQASVPSKSLAQHCGAKLEDKGNCPRAMAAETPRGLALGTGLRAAAISTSALAYSAAAVSLGKLYHIEGNVDYMVDAKTAALGAAVVDSSTGKLGAGIGLRGFLSSDANGSFDGLDGRVALGLAVSDAFSIGLGGRYIDLSQDQSSSSKEVAQGFTMDASARVTLGSGFQIDVASLNFVDLGNYYVPVMLTSGVAVAVGSELSLGVDLLTDLSTFDKAAFVVGGGVEYLAGNTVPLRAGYDFDITRKIHDIGLGLGYTDRELGLDIGLKQEVSGGSATRIMAAVRYYVE